MINMNEKNKINEDRKRYDLEERTLKFTKGMTKFAKLIPQNLVNNIILSQVIRSSSSIGANYIEANEALSQKDFIMRLKICRKESKETAYWLDALDLEKEELRKECKILHDEAIQLKKIFSAIILKSKPKNQ
jgi:four helix bundle protein